MITIKQKPTSAFTSYITVLDENNHEIPFKSAGMRNTLVDRYVNELRKIFMDQGQSVLHLKV